MSFFISHGRRIMNGVILIGIAIGLFYMSLHNFLLFHSLVELFVIAVAFSIFIVAWNARRVLDNHFFLFLGIGYLFVGGINLLHVLAYKGMNIFHGYGADLATQLWIAWQYLMTFSFLGAFAFVSKKLNADIVLWSFTGGVALLIGIIFTGYFPSCFIEGQGLTLFKKFSEIATSCLLALTLLLFKKYGYSFSTEVVQWCIGTILFAIAGKMFFIFYSSVYGLSNLFGHYMMVLSFFCLYKAIVETGISKPSELLFKKLKFREAELESVGNALKIITDELEKLVDIRTRDLEKANTLLEQRNIELEHTNSQLDDFAYVVSHDLREPLRGMFNYSQMLLDDYGDRVDENGHRMLERLTVLARRQEEQIQALLQYARIGRAVPKISPTDMNTLVDDVLEEIRFFLDQEHAKIHVLPSLPDSTPCDRDLVRKVFQNLIVNAVRYNDQPEKNVEIGFQNTNNGSPVFYVRDNGIGIPKRYHDTIFKIFKRLHNKTEYGGGTGVGLTIVEKIIRHHGGKIWLDSDTGKGTTFYFTLAGSGRG